MVANKRMSPEKAADREISRVPKLPAAAGDSRDQAFIGTSGWAYASWKPGFYPQALPQKKFLEYYATQLNSVEVNYTFRQLPTEGMLKGWLAASGAGFRFSFKAPQRITHILRLRDCSDTVVALSRVLAPVVAAGRMGVVLFQLPPNFKADVSRLDSFLRGCEHVWVADGFRISAQHMVLRRSVCRTAASRSRALCSRERRSGDARCCDRSFRLLPIP